MCNLAYRFGQSLAIKIAGQQEATWKDRLKQIAPYILGAGAGLGAYKYLRTPRLSSNSMLRKMQERAGGKLTYLSSLNKKNRVQNPALVKALHGADEIISVNPDTLKETRRRALRNIRKGDPYKEGITQTPVEGALLPDANEMAAAGLDPDVLASGSPSKTRKLRDKLIEAELWNKYAPGAMANTNGIANVMDEARILDSDSVSNKLQKLQSYLQKKHPEGYVIKPVDAEQSGKVITNEHNLSELLTNAPHDHMKVWAKSMAQNPEGFLVQSKIPIAESKSLISGGRVGGTKQPLGFMNKVNDEYRVHAIHGQVVPGASTHRWSISKSLNPFNKDRKAAEKALQGYLDKLPNHEKNYMMNVDVVKNTKGGFNVIETNPGPGSGFATPETSGIPSLVPHKIYKAITGRESKVMAGLKGSVLGASAIGGLTGAEKAISSFDESGSRRK